MYRVYIERFCIIKCSFTKIIDIFGGADGVGADGALYHFLFWKFYQQHQSSWRRQVLPKCASFWSGTMCRMLYQCLRVSTDHFGKFWVSRFGAKCLMILGKLLGWMKVGGMGWWLVGWGRRMYVMTPPLPPPQKKVGGVIWPKLKKWGGGGLMIFKKWGPNFWGGVVSPKLEKCMEWGGGLENFWNGVATCWQHWKTWVEWFHQNRKRGGGGGGLKFWKLGGPNL